MIKISRWVDCERVRIHQRIDLHSGLRVPKIFHRGLNRSPDMTWKPNGRSMSYPSFAEIPKVEGGTLSLRFNRGYGHEAEVSRRIAISYWIRRNQRGRTR
jgi:hypothetical protein